MNKKIIITAACCTMILLIATASALAQGNEVDLQEQRITIRLSKQPLGVVFKYLMETYDISIGFEQSILDRDHSDYSFQTNLPSLAEKRMESLDRRVRLDVEVESFFEAKKHRITVIVENGALKDVFDQIVREMGNYKWEINDGVVNIIPVRGRDERFKELMETEVKNFSLQKGMTVNDITFRIIRSSAFNRWLRINKLHFNPARTGSSILLRAQYGRALDGGMNFSDLNFRELLNKITKSKKGGWILKWRSTSANGEEHIDLDI